MRWAAGSISEMSTYYCPALAYQSDWDNKKVYVLRIGKFEVHVRMSMLNIRRRKPMRPHDAQGPAITTGTLHVRNQCLENRTNYFPPLTN